MQKNMLIAVGSGGLSAVASMAFLTGSPGGLFFVYLATLPLFLVAFSTGPMAAGIAGASGFMIAGLLGGLIAAAMYGVVHAVPAWLVSRQVLSRQGEAGPWKPVGRVLCLLTLMCTAVLLGAALPAVSSTGGIAGAIEQHLLDAFRAMAPGMAANQRELLAATLTPLFPGAMGSSWVVMTVVNAIIAQAILTRAGKALRPSPVFGELTLPQWMAWPLIAAAALALLASGDAKYVAQNLAIMLAVPYFFLGLAVVHWAVRQASMKGLVLGAFYFVLLISGWALLVVAAIGMLEQWAGLRGRFGGNQPGGGNGTST